MKKFFIVSFVIFTLFLGSMYYILNDNKLNPDMIYEVIYLEKVYVYYIKDDQLVLVEMNKLGDDDVIIEVFNYLTINKNYAELEYYSYVSCNCQILDYSTEDNVLTLNFNKLFYLITDNEELMVAQIVNTYKLLGYDDVILKVDGILVTKINDYYLNT